MEDKAEFKLSSISARAKINVYLPTAILLIVLNGILFHQNIPTYSSPAQVLGATAPTPAPTINQLQPTATPSQAPTGVPVTPTPTTPTPTTYNLQPSISAPTPTPTINPKYQGGTFKHPKFNYSLVIPDSWTGEMPTDSPNTLIIYSPDYKFSPGLTYGTVISGAELSIIVVPTKAISIDTIFESKVLTQEVAKNKIGTDVAGIPAIQYDYNFEGYIATMTEFINSGQHYAIKYRYADSKSKPLNWTTYLLLLNSFKPS